MSDVEIKINDEQLRFALKNFTQRIKGAPLLKIAGDLMRGSIDRTFRDQGSPPGSWPPLASSTLKRDPSPGRKMLIRSGRLKNSITYAVVGDNRLLIGTNLRYAAIQQLGGMAGRGHKSKIPARPYLVFRPEDPERLRAGMDAEIQRQIDAAGLGGK